MDIVDLCAYTFIQQALVIHRTTMGLKDAPQYHAAEIAKLAKVTLDVKLQAVCEDCKIQRSQRIILRVKDLVHAMPLRSDVETLVMIILSQLIKHIFRDLGLDW